MKNWKRRAAALLVAAALFCSLAMPASAEGFAFNWDSDQNSAPHCESIFMLNLDTDTVVYTLNPDEERPIASLTKIMTYIVAYENIPDIETAIITMPQSVQDELEGTGSSVAEMAPGESFTGLDLLYMMMVQSGNNAALTLAKYVDSLYETGQLRPQTTATPAPEASAGEDTGSAASAVTAAASAGSEASSEDRDDPEAAAPTPGTLYGYGAGSGDGDAAGEFDPAYPDYTGTSYFVQLMNAKAAELGCTHTHFVNPHGLHHRNHFSTAREMAIITKYAMTLPNFTEITGSTGYDYTVQNTGEQRWVGTTNKLLTNYQDDASGLVYYYQSATGIKTGSLNESGYCISASATANGYTYIAVALGSPYINEDGSRNYVHGEMLDVRSLFRWAVANLEKRTVLMKDEVASSVNLRYAWRQDTLQLVAGENATVMLPSSINDSSILITADVPESVEAPIRKGEAIGTAVMTYAGETIAVVPLVAAESVDRSEVIHVLKEGQDVMSSPVFLVIMAVIAALIIVYIILIVFYRRKQKQLRKVRKFRDM